MQPKFENRKQIMSGLLHVEDLFIHKVQLL